MKLPMMHVIFLLAMFLVASNSKENETSLLKYFKNLKLALRDDKLNHIPSVHEILTAGDPQKDKQKMEVHDVIKESTGNEADVGLQYKNIFTRQSATDDAQMDRPNMEVYDALTESTENQADVGMEVHDAITESTKNQADVGMEVHDAITESTKNKADVGMKVHDAITESTKNQADVGLQYKNALTRNKMSTTDNAQMDKAKTEAYGAIKGSTRNTAGGGLQYRSVSPQYESLKTTDAQLNEQMVHKSFNDSTWYQIDNGPTYRMRKLDDPYKNLAIHPSSPLFIADLWYDTNTGPGRMIECRYKADPIIVRIGKNGERIREKGTVKKFACNGENRNKKP